MQNLDQRKRIPHWAKIHRFKRDFPEVILEKIKITSYCVVTHLEKGEGGIRFSAKTNKNSNGQCFSVRQFDYFFLSGQHFNYFFKKLLKRIFLICQRRKEQSKEQKKKIKNGI